MYIIAAAAPPDPLAPLWPALLMAVAAATFVAMRIPRRRSIVGPARWSENDTGETYAIAFCVGFGAFFCVSLAASKIPGVTLTPSPSTPALIADMFARAVGVAVILGAINLLNEPVSRLGLRLSNLPSGLFLGAAAMLLVLPLMLIVSELWSLHLKEQYTHDLLKLLGSTQSPAMKWLLLTSITIVAPISEEIFFRGTMQTLFSAALSKLLEDKRAATARWIAVILTSMAFACVHPWWSWPPIFVLALCLGYAYERTGNLWTSITIHALFNAAEVLFFYQQSHA